MSPSPSRALMGSALALVASVAACSSAPVPADCGDSPAAIVTFRGAKSDADDIRSCIDIHAESRRDATATSAGLDESFATSRPSAIPWTNLTFEEAVQACGRAGKFLCNVEELQAIAPTRGQATGTGDILWRDETITALPPTSTATKVDHRFDALNPYDMVIGGQTGKPPFPESYGSVAYWTTSAPRTDKSVAPSTPRLLGRLTGAGAAGGVLVTTPVLDAGYRHPLVGFRCCINAKLRSAFAPLPPDPSRIRKEADNVPIQGR